jgi:hypothetical protein
MRKDALFVTTLASFLVVIFTFFGHVKEVIRRPTVIKGLMSVHAVVPIVIFALISAILSLVSIQIK